MRLLREDVHNAELEDQAHDDRAFVGGAAPVPEVLQVLQKQKLADCAHGRAQEGRWTVHPLKTAPPRQGYAGF